MKHLLDILLQSTDFLQKKEVHSPRLVAEQLLAHVLGVNRMDLYMQFDRPLDEGELAALRPLLKRAASHEPVAYLIGEVPFYGVQIAVNRDVLIPRPETEILVDHVVKAVNAEIVEIWDVCCGSGCIGIALKKRFPHVRVVLSDVSSQALQVAEENAKRNQVDVEIIYSDLLEGLQGRKADIIVCNPPYITSSEYEQLASGVKDFEPKTALLAGDGGLECYERIQKNIAAFLHPGAKVFFEIGKDQGKAIQNVFSDPIWTHRSVVQDWAGHDRFFFLEFQ